MNFHRLRQLLARFPFVESSSIRNFQSETNPSLDTLSSRVHLSRFERLVREERTGREGKMPVHLSRDDGESENDGNSLEITVCAAWNSIH